MSRVVKPKAIFWSMVGMFGTAPNMIRLGCSPPAAPPIWRGVVLVSVAVYAGIFVLLA
jgi:hypothetical protein